MLRSFFKNFLSKMKRTANCVSFLACLSYLKLLTIQIKPYTICSSHQLGFEVERPERSTTFSLSRYFTQ